MTGPLGGRLALVTGGTRGIGRSIALDLARSGALVVVSGQSEEGCHRAAVELSGMVTVVESDVRDPDDVDRLVARTVECGGRDGLDILVNNAGSFIGGALDDLEHAQWTSAFDTKLMGAVRLTQSATEALVAAQGVVVNVSGGSAMQALGPAAVSGVINAGVMAYTTYLARELGPRGVRVCGISPGLTATTSWLARAEDLAGAEGREVDDVLHDLLVRQGAAHARWVQPDEIARLVTFLVSDGASAVHGSTIRVDAGQSTRTDSA